MADFSKRIAVLALVAAAGCDDSFPPVPGPLDRFYYPVGLAVRRLPAGNTALLVVSSNFDLRYDYDVGGAVLAVDPDASGDSRPVAEGGAGDPTLAVLGGLNIGSFGGEIDYLDGACAPLAAADPPVAAGGAKVVVASRGKQIIYALDMDAQGALACDGCAQAPMPEALDPYGVTAVCDESGSSSVARAYVTHLRGPYSAGYLSEVDLRTGVLTTRSHSISPTYTSTYHRDSKQLFVSSRFGTPVFASVTWFDVFVSPPAVLAVDITDLVRDGVLPGKLAFSSDGTLGYLALDLADARLWASGGVPVLTGGALTVFDMTPGPFGTPSWRLLRMVPTCVAAGQIEVLPRTPSGQPDLVAITCPSEGTLLLYDEEIGAVAGRIGLDPDSGLPLLGRQPFGLAHESLPAARCRSGSDCTRIYVGSFDRSWVSLVELDPDSPQSARIVKRIGRERD